MIYIALMRVVLFNFKRRSTKSTVECKTNTSLTFKSEEIYRKMY